MTPAVYVWLALVQAHGVDGPPTVDSVFTTETACRRYLRPLIALHRDPRMPEDKSLYPLKVSCEKRELYTDADVADQEAARDKAEQEVARIKAEQGAARVPEKP